MPTPDPIALPELPKSLDSVRVIARGVPESARPHGHYYNVEQLRAYGQACVDALAPAPRVPGDMVLVPREPTPSMCAAGFIVSEAEHDPGGVYRAMIGAFSTDAIGADQCETCGRSEPLQPIEYKEALNTIGNFNPGADEFTNALEVLRNHAPSTPPLNELLGQREEFNLNEVSGNPGQLASLEQRARGFLQEHSPDFQAGETRIHYFGALRAITAALNEASRAPQ